MRQTPAGCQTKHKRSRCRPKTWSCRSSATTLGSHPRAGSTMVVIASLQARFVVISLFSAFSWTGTRRPCTHACAFAGVLIDLSASPFERRNDTTLQRRPRETRGGGLSGCPPAGSAGAGPGPRPAGRAVPARALEPLADAPRPRSAGTRTSGTRHASSRFAAPFAEALPAVRGMIEGPRFAPSRGHYLDLQRL